MAVFISASDESLGDGVFHHAGYLAPQSCWDDVFCPAWEEKVLNPYPQIDEFHVTALRSRAWREKHGMSMEEAESRIDAAVDVVYQTKGMFGVRCSIDGNHFRDHASGLQFALVDPGRAPADMVMDYPSFLGYLYLVLEVFSMYHKAEKVDFIIEKKSEVFPAIRDFHEAMRQSLVGQGLSRKADLMGGLIPGDKKSIPLQAADLLCWHTQRAFANLRNPSITFSETDRVRFAKLTRRGSGVNWELEMVEELCAALFEDLRRMKEGNQ